MPAGSMDSTQCRHRCPRRVWFASTNNKYSVAASAVGRPVEVHAYADRIVIRQDGRIVAEHPRLFGRGDTLYDPWHYVPVLARKPGALRNGAPFKDWVLPAAMERVRRKLASADDGNRQMVNILTAVLTDGLPAVEAACAPALLDPVEKPLDQISRPVEIWAEADCFFTITLRRDVCPRAFVAGKRSDPVGIITAIRQQHCMWAQFTQQNRAKLIVVRLTGREADLYWQAIGVHDGVNFSCKAASGSAHMLLTTACDAASVLMHAHD
jgi:hypothetical protein